MVVKNSHQPSVDFSIDWTSEKGMGQVSRLSCVTEKAVWGWSISYSEMEESCLGWKDIMQHPPEESFLCWVQTFQVGKMPCIGPVHCRICSLHSA